MKFIKKEVLTEGQKEEIYSLWNDEYPEKLTHRNLESFEDYLDGVAQKLHLLLLDDQEQIIGWLFLFERNEEDWLAMIVAGKLQGKGYGTRLLKEAMLHTDTLNGWVIDHFNDRKLNGDIYRSPLAFYLKNGFRLVAEERFESAKMSAVKIRSGQ